MYNDFWKSIYNIVKKIKKMAVPARRRTAPRPFFVFCSKNQKSTRFFWYSCLTMHSDPGLRPGSFQKTLLMHGGLA